MADETEATGEEDGLGPTLDFEDVVVSPFSSLLGRPAGGPAHQGGPAWPDWDRQTVARHQRNGRPIDVEPMAEEAERTIDEPSAWGGAVVRHFGHVLAEFSMRLVTSLADRPERAMLFAAHPSDPYTAPQDLPDHVRAIHAWVGLTSERTRIVIRPTRFAVLSVSPQAEQLGGDPPTAAHLDRLDELVERRLGGGLRARLRRRRGPRALFVSRAATRHAIAGDAEIERVLAAAGVATLRPEALPLRDQLDAYARAETLIFTEGSALHGLQLLGRQPGDVVVIRRRTGPVVAEPAIRARARSLRTVDARMDELRELAPDGSPTTTAGLTLVDTDGLRDGLEAIVPGVADAWRQRRFAEAVADDISRFLDRWAAAADGRPGVDRAGSWADMRRRVRECATGVAAATLDEIGRRHGLV